MPIFSFPQCDEYKFLHAPRAWHLCAPRSLVQHRPSSDMEVAL